MAQETSVQVKRGFAGFGMRPDQGMTDTKRYICLDLVHEFFRQTVLAFPKKAPVVMHSIQMLNLVLQFFRQPQVAGMTVRKQGVTTQGWCGDQLGDGAQGWFSMQVTSVWNPFSTPGDFSS